MLVFSLIVSSCGPVDSPEIQDAVEAAETTDTELDDSTEDTAEEVEAEVVETEESDEVEESQELEDTDSEAEIEEETEDESENEVETEVVDETNESEIDTSSSETTYTIQFVDDGFDPTELTISAGDTVVWENARTGNYLQAMLLGTRTYTDIKSDLLEVGESYNYTFEEAGEYIFVDAILTTYVNTITVE
tara:strand:+ start:1236 stop:1808 length:573 start_codon:yes stop_codon:yes gene_type:complete